MSISVDIFIVAPACVVPRSARVSPWRPDSTSLRPAQGGLLAATALRFAQSRLLAAAPLSLAQGRLLAATARRLAQGGHLAATSLRSLRADYPSSAVPIKFVAQFCLPLPLGFGVPCWLASPSGAEPYSPDAKTDRCADDAKIFRQIFFKAALIWFGGLLYRPF